MRHACYYFVILIHWARMGAARRIIVASQRTCLYFLNPKLPGAISLWWAESTSEEREAWIVRAELEPSSIPMSRVQEPSLLPIALNVSAHKIWWRRLSNVLPMHDDALHGPHCRVSHLARSSCNPHESAADNFAENSSFKKRSKTDSCHLVVAKPRELTFVFDVGAAFSE